MSDCVFFTIVLYTLCSVGEKDINVCLWVFIINSTVHFMLCGREGY